MAFVFGGQVYQEESGAFPVRGSKVVLAFEGGRAITDAKGLRSSDFKVFGDLAAAEAAKKKNH